MAEKDSESQKNLSKKAYIKWFSELSIQDYEIAGTKGAILSELHNNKFPVPQGFVVTFEAFFDFINNSGMSDRIESIIETIDMENFYEVLKRSKEIRDLIESFEIPKKIQEEIIEAYEILGYEKISTRGVSQDALNILKNSREPIFAAVRSSVVDNLKESSFIGLYDNFINVKGNREIIQKIKACYSSLFSPHSLFYINKIGLKNFVFKMAVVIQKTVYSERSGIILSKDPINNTNNLIIESIYGFLDLLTSGRINPDNYTISDDLKIKNINLSEKKVALIRTGSGTSEIIKLSNDRSNSQTLNNGQILEVCNYALRIEQLLKKPQAIEFALESDKIFILQSRPLIFSNKEKKVISKFNGKVIAEGNNASLGLITGNIKIIKEISDLSKIKKNDIIVCENITKELIYPVLKSFGIIIENSGITSNISTLARELQIPCLVGVKDASKILKEGMKITLDSNNSKIYEGEISESSLKEIKPIVETKKLKLKLVLDSPDYSDIAALTGIAFVGILKLENLIKEFEMHPLEYERQGRLDKYTEILRKGIEKVSEQFNEISVRIPDLVYNKQQNLEGVFEQETNPLLGNHGIRFSFSHLKIFESEIIAIKKVSERFPMKKFIILIPGIVSVEDYDSALKILNNFKTRNLDFGIIIDTPAGVQIIDDLCKLDIRTITINSDNLTIYSLAVDPENEEIKKYYNKFHPAVLNQIKRVIGTCRRYKIETNIFGEFLINQEILKFLFFKGINYISIPPENAYDISFFINQLEQEHEKKIQIFKKQNANNDLRSNLNQIEQKDYIDLNKNNEPMDNLEIDLENYDKLNSNKIDNELDNIEIDLENHNENKIIIENIGNIEPIDDLSFAQQKSDIIHKEVKLENLEKLKQDELNELKIDISIQKPNEKENKINGNLRNSKDQKRGQNYFGFQDFEWEDF
jgi:pyruvate,water dikinase